MQNQLHARRYLPWISSILEANGDKKRQKNVTFMQDKRLQTKQNTDSVLSLFRGWKKKKKCNFIKIKMKPSDSKTT